MATLISEFEIVQFEIEALGKYESLNIEEKERDEFEEGYFNALSLAQSLLSSSSNLNKSNNQSMSSSASNIKRNVTLPKINLPVFDGSYENWYNFRIHSKL